MFHSAKIIIFYYFERVLGLMMLREEQIAVYVDRLLSESDNVQRGYILNEVLEDEKRQIFTQFIQRTFNSLPTLQKSSSLDHWKLDVLKIIKGFQGDKDSLYLLNMMMAVLDENNIPYDKPDCEALKLTAAKMHISNRDIKLILSSDSPTMIKAQQTLKMMIAVLVRADENVFAIRDSKGCTIAEALMIKPSLIPDSKAIVIKHISHEDIAARIKLIRACIDSVIRRQQNDSQIDKKLNEVIQCLYKYEPTYVKENAIAWLQYTLDLDLMYQHEISPGRHVLINGLLKLIEGDIDATKNYRKERNDSKSREEQSFMVSLAHARGLSKSVRDAIFTRLIKREGILPITLQDIVTLGVMDEARALALRAQLSTYTEGLPIPLVLAEAMSNLNIDFVQWLVEEAILEVTIQSLGVLPKCINRTRAQTEPLISLTMLGYQSWVEKHIVEIERQEQELVEEKQLKKMEAIFQKVLNPVQQELENVKAELQAVKAELARVVMTQDQADSSSTERYNPSIFKQSQ